MGNIFLTQHLLYELKLHLPEEFLKFLRFVYVPTLVIEAVNNSKNNQAENNSSPHPPRPAEYRGRGYGFVVVENHRKALELLDHVNKFGILRHLKQKGREFPSADFSRRQGLEKNINAIQVKIWEKKIHSKRVEKIRKLHSKRV